MSPPSYHLTATELLVETDVPDSEGWDAEFDVVVAGYGYAGAIAAMAAHDAGRNVAIFEKMPHFGGNSILSGGSVVAAREYEPALKYLRRTTMGTTDDDVLVTQKWRANHRSSLATIAAMLKPRRAIGVE